MAGQQQAENTTPQQGGTAPSARQLPQLQRVTTADIRHVEAVMRVQRSRP